MRGMQLLIVLGALLWAAPHALADARRILLLHHAAWRKEEAALLEALRIYTRDLDGAIVSSDASSEATLPAGGRALAAVAEQGQKAAAIAVAWFSDEDGLRLHTLRVATMDLQITPVRPREDLDVAAQTLALKLRAFLTQEAAPASAPQLPESGPANRQPRGADDLPSASAAAQVKEGDAKKGTSTLSELATPLPPQASPGERLTGSPVRAAIKAQRPLHLEVGFGYGIDVPLDPQWLRHLLVLRTALVFSKLPLSIELDGAAATRPTVAAAPYQVSIGDSPIGLALSVRLLRPRFLLSLGPRASLHIVQAAVQGESAPGGEVFRFSAGLGAVAQARLRLLRFLSLNLAVIAEGTVPRQRFTVGGSVAADLGAFRFGSSLGVLFEVL